VHFFRLKRSNTNMPTLHRYNIPAGLLRTAPGAFILQQSVQWEFLDEYQNELRVIFKGAGVNVVH
jgi:hypothetical protein